MAESRMVCVRFAEGEVLAMDVARGSESRSAWIRRLVMDGLVARQTLERLRTQPDPEAVVTVVAAVAADAPAMASHLPTCRCPLCVGVR